MVDAWSSLAILTSIPFVGRTAVTPLPIVAKVAASLPDRLATIEIAKEIKADIVANTGKRSSDIDAVDAIGAYAAELIDAIPGDITPIGELYELYLRMRRRPSSPWPMVSTKALAQGLKARGFRRVQEDRREQGRGRPVCYVIPDALK